MAKPIKPPRLPIGTQVVTRVDIKPSDGPQFLPKGSIGEIIEFEQGDPFRYRVRFADGCMHLYFRNELTIRKHQHKEKLEKVFPAIDPEKLYPYVIYRCVVGSRAFGLETENSDTDRRGIFLPPASLHWSLQTLPEQLENEDRQECFWELEKFITLGLKANPNVLECLYTPLVEFATPLARELLSIRDKFLSKMIYQTFNGYTLSQFEKLERDIRNSGQIKWKHAMHLIRLLISGTRALLEGHLDVQTGDYRDRLMEIKQGLMPWEEANRWRLELHRQLDEAYTKTRLPDVPDYETVNAFLIKARQSMV